MKKINLKGISEVLSEKELKNVMGGSGHELHGCKCPNGKTFSASPGLTCEEAMNYILRLLRNSLKFIKYKIHIDYNRLKSINLAIIGSLFWGVSCVFAQNTTIVFHTKENSKVEISKEIDNTYNNSLTDQINADNTGNCIYSWDVYDFQFIECTFYDGGSLFFPIKEGSHLTVIYKGDFQAEIIGADKTEVEYYRNGYKDIITRPFMISLATLSTESRFEDVLLLIKKYDSLLSKTLDSLVAENKISPRFSKIIKNDFQTFTTCSAIGFYRNRYLEDTATKVNEQDSVKADNMINELLDKISPMIGSGEITKYALNSSILTSFYNSKYRQLNEKKKKELLFTKSWAKYLNSNMLGYLIAPEEIQCKLLALKLLGNYQNAETKGNSEFFNYISEIRPQNAFLPYLKKEKDRLSASINANHGEIKYIQSTINTLKDLSKVGAFDEKVLFIDFWATWCGPCIAEFKYKDMLHELLLSYKDIIPVYISIDEDKNDSLWKEKSKALNINGYHLRANEELLADICEKIYKGGVIGVPQFILLDKNGNILKQNLPWPHDMDKLKQELDKLF